MPRVTVKEILPVSNSADSSTEYLGAKPTPRSHNQMFDLPPGVRNYPPPPLVGYKAGERWHGSLRRVSCSRRLVQRRCVHMHIATWTYLLGICAKKKSGKCDLELLVDYNMRSALHTFSCSKMINMFSGSPSNTQYSEAQQDSEMPSR